MESENQVVLVADDNQVNRFILQKFFKKWDIPADFVENGRDAVVAAKGKSYQLVIMDLHMPEMNGLQATKAIKEEFPDLAVIGLSASVSEEERAAAEQAGMIDFILKPFDPEQLRVKIKAFLEVE